MGVPIKNFITKDGRQLSKKQINILLSNGVTSTLDKTYKECSKIIGDFLDMCKDEYFDSIYCSIDDGWEWDVPISPWGD